MLRSWRRGRPHRGKLLCETLETYIHSKIGRINPPNAQLARNMNFSKNKIDGTYRFRNGISCGSRAGDSLTRERERARKSECDNIIQVTILMGALLKWLYYSSAIIAGNALHRANVLGSLAQYAQNFRPMISRECQSQLTRIIWVQPQSNFPNYTAAS